MRDGEVVISVHRPPLKEKLFFLLSGMISSVPLTLFVDQFASSFLSSLSVFYSVLISAVIFSPFIEEFAKAFPLLYRHGETERSIFILGLLVGLGFGFVEFLLYVFVLGVPFISRLGGIVFHAASTSIIAYGIATRRAALFYLVSVTLHFLNNLVAFVFSWVDPAAALGSGSLGSYAVMVATLYLSVRLYSRTSEKIAT
jgi:RsiW-degrading membrane proteinase PrsW (M82 family)